MQLRRHSPLNVLVIISAFVFMLPSETEKHYHMCFDPYKPEILCLLQMAPVQYQLLVKMGLYKTSVKAIDGP